MTTQVVRNEYLLLMTRLREPCTAADGVIECAVAKSALLLPLEQASPHDAQLACFLACKLVTKVVIIVNKLLTDAYPAILHALKVSCTPLNC